MMLSETAMLARHDQQTQRKRMSCRKFDAKKLIRAKYEIAAATAQ
jgi:hypothetical protein